jgi:putative ABC transport system ATP-binding protein
MPEPLISLRDVWKNYALDGWTIDALRGVDLEIAAGEFVVLLGPSGSGKSTLLHLVGAMDRPTRGTILLDGRDISSLPAIEQAELRLRRIGFVFQTFNLISTLNARDNVSLPMRLAGVGRRQRAKRAVQLLEMVGLAERAMHLPRQLSGGQRQRVAIARALANDPALILADEPTGNLDTESGSAVMQLLRATQRRGTTVLLVTHDLGLIEDFDRVLVIRDGRLEPVASWTASPSSIGSVLRSPSTRGCQRRLPARFEHRRRGQ